MARKIPLVASCYSNKDKLQPGGPLGSYAAHLPVSNNVLTFHCPIFTHAFWRQQFHWRFMHRSLLRMLLQLGVSISSGNSNFGFCSKFLFLGAGYQPTAQPPTWKTRDCSSSGLYPLTNPAWLDLPETKVPTGTALGVTETHKLHHHNKVSAQGADFTIITLPSHYLDCSFKVVLSSYNIPETITNWECAKDIVQY